MKHWGLYRCLLDFVPADGRLNRSDFSKTETKTIVETLRRHRCLGAALCRFDPSGAKGTLTFGVSHLPDALVTPDTVFRAASISKFVTGLGIMKLKEQGKIDLDRDVNEYLPFSLRHPKAPDQPLTLRMFMTHTAGVHDGVSYNQGIAQAAPLSELLKGDSFTGHLPGGLWEYSNFGAGIAGVVMEAATGVDFETLMQETLFQPLGVTAAFYPQKVQGDLADAIRILPRSRTPNFNAANRRAQPMPSAEVDLERHYNLAHGNLYISAPELAKLGAAAMTPGFLARESLEEMRKITVPFGKRASNLSQGLFTFVLHEPKISGHLIYGHQGMAYGAVHGLFFDPETGEGFVVLTTGASEARRGVLADLNFSLMKDFRGGG